MCQDQGCLIQTAEIGSVVSGLSGRQRALAYLTALSTGLRASELASLTKSSFNLKNLDNASLVLMAAYSKHRDDDIIPIRRDLAEALSGYISALKYSEQVFNLPEKTAFLD